MSPTVSVAIATFNYGQYLPAAIRSALGQTFADLEVVVVDDGSTDNTPDVIAPFLSDSRVRYRRTENRGVGAAKSLAVRECSGEFIGFLDADDVWLPEKLERQLARFREDPELGLVSTQRILMAPDGRRHPYVAGGLQRGHVLQQMFLDNFVCFSSCMVRRAVIDDVGSFDESLKLAVDYDLWLRIAAKYRFDFVDEPLVCYRTGHSNLSQREEERSFVALGIMGRFLEEHDGRRLLDPATVRHAYADTFTSLGYVQRSRSRLASVRSYLRALGWQPLWWPAWRGLMTVWIPQSLRQWMAGAEQSATIVG